MFDQESRSVSPRPRGVPVQCVNTASSVPAVNQSPGTDRTGSAVPVPCRPSDELVDVEGVRSEQQRDRDIASRLDQVSIQSLTGSQTVPARLHQNSDSLNQRSRQRAPLRNAFSCDTGIMVYRPILIPPDNLQRSALSNITAMKHTA